MAEFYFGLRCGGSRRQYGGYNKCEQGSCKQHDFPPGAFCGSARQPDRAPRPRIISFEYQYKLRRLRQADCLSRLPRRTQPEPSEPEIDAQRAPLGILADNIVAPDQVDIDVVLRRKTHAELRARFADRIE